MARLRDGGPYIWATWLTKLLAGEDSCEWSSWFKSQYDSRTWEKAPSNYDLAQWQIRHTDLLHRCAEDYRQQGYTVTLEGQNQITLQGQAATVSGKPDLIARLGDMARIIDTKTGEPRASHHAQVMLYMYLLPLARPEYRGAIITGQVVYEDHVVDIPADAVDERFINSVKSLIQRIGAREPAVKAPSRGQCRFCDITSADCPERVEGPDRAVATTDQF